MRPHDTSPGNRVFGTRTMSAPIGKSLWRTNCEPVDFIIAKATAQFLVSTTGERYKISTLGRCESLTPRQVAERRVHNARELGKLLTTA
jgi:hypothetical protein